MIEFLSRPPKMRLDTLPIGAVFVHAGNLYEVKRDPLTLEARMVCYRWNRDDRPEEVDRRELVSPLGRVTFDDRRKTIKLGLLEVAQPSASQTAEPLALEPPSKALPAHGKTDKQS